MTHPTRRRALLGLLAAPVIIRTPGLLMPVRRVLTKPDFDFHLDVAADGMTRRQWRVATIRGVDFGTGKRDWFLWATLRDGVTDFTAAPA